MMPPLKFNGSQYYTAVMLSIILWELSPVIFLRLIVCSIFADSYPLCQYDAFNNDFRIEKECGYDTRVA